MINIDFKFYLSLFWRRFPLFLLVWFTIATIGVVTAYLLPSIYKSEARVLVEGVQITGVGDDEVNNIATSEIIQRIEQQLLSRTNMLDLAERFNALGSYSGFSPTEKVDIMRESTAFQIVEQGGRDIRRGIETAPVFTIAFYSEDPRTALNITNEMVSMILEENIRIQTEGAVKSREFYEQRKTELQNELADLEQQIVYFKNENSDALPDSLEFRREEMSRIQTRLLALDNQELTLQEQRAQYQRILDDPTLIATIDSNAGRQSPQERLLLDLQRRLAQESAIYSDSNPRIISLRAEIAALEGSMTSTGSDENGAPVNPRLGEVRLSMQDVEANLRLIVKQRLDLETQLAGLATSVQQTPNVEAQLNVLNRGLSSLEADYEENERLLNQARKGSDITLGGQGETFNIIEQPDFPDEPVSPNRLLIAVGSILGGLAAGVGLIVLLELLNQSVRRPVELINRLGIHPFATVPYIATKSEILQRRLRAGLSIVAVAICVPALLYTIHHYYMPIDLIVSKVADRFGLDEITRFFNRT